MLVTLPCGIIILWSFYWMRLAHCEITILLLSNCIWCATCILPHQKFSHCTWLAHYGILLLPSLHCMLLSLCFCCSYIACCFTLRYNYLVVLYCMWLTSCGILFLMFLHCTWLAYCTIIFLLFLWCGTLIYAAFKFAYGWHIIKLCCCCV